MVSTKGPGRMRNALFIISVVLISAASSFASANDRLASVRSSYAPALAGTSSDMLPDPASGQLSGLSSLVPVRFDGLPQTPLADQSPISSAVPQSSAVEAIPTPTAFHAGGLLLLLLFLSRCVRKVRWN